MSTAVTPTILRQVEPLDQPSGVAEAPRAARVLDPESREWLRSLQAEGAVREDAIARLHALLLKAARL